jgi:UDP-N-acetyl-D-mannosaminuronic acid dehydrogenase
LADPGLAMSEADVCIVGLGYVGLTLATAFAEAGLVVAGVERNSDVVALIAAGKSPFHETGLDEALAAVVASGRLTALPSQTATPRARAYIITVGTPLRDGAVQLSDLEDALTKVGQWMPDDALVVLRSTVLVGTTSGLAAGLLAQTGKPFSLAMAPERTIEGRALAELTSLPQIIGGYDSRSASVAAALFARLGVEIVHVDTPEAAELAKLSSNTYRDLTFAFANELAYFADSAGVDVYEVIRACNYGYDRMNLALPGPVAGPCLEKDAYILSDSAERFGTSVPLSMQGRQTNERIVEHVQSMIGTLLSDHPAEVGILGLAFKGRPETSDVRGSLALNFAASFVAEWPDVLVRGWDPLVSIRDSASMGITFDELARVISGSSVLLVQTNHRYFSSDEFTELLVESAQHGALIVDLWNQVDGLNERRPDIRIAALGRMTRVGAR